MQDFTQKQIIATDKKKAVVSVDPDVIKEMVEQELGRQVERTYYNAKNVFPVSEVVRETVKEVVREETRKLVLASRDEIKEAIRRNINFDEIADAFMDVLIEGTWRNYLVNVNIDVKEDED